MNRIRLLIGLTLAWPIHAQSPSSTPPSMFRADAMHHGVFDGVAARHFGGMSWRVQTDGPVHASPVVAGATVYVGSTDGTLYAIRASSGEVQWRANVNAPIASSVAVANSRIFVFGNDGVLRALDALSGRTRWTYATGKPVALKWGLESGLLFESSPTVSGDLVLVGARDGRVHAVDRVSGRLRWAARIGSRVYTSPAVANGVVVVGAQDGTVHAVSLADGTTKWTFRTLGAELASRDFGFDRTTVQSSPAIANGMVYVGARDGVLYGIELASGKERWRMDHKVSWVNSSPAISDGLIFAASSDGHFVQAVDASSGREQWRTPTVNIVWASPTVDRELVYIGEADGTMYALNKRTGAVRWKWRGGARIISSAALANGLVVFGSDDGGVFALDGTAPPLQRAVFWDTTSVEQPFVQNRARLRSYLGDRGYQVLGSGALMEFMSARVRDNTPSVVVFSMEHLPTALSVSANGSTLFQRYLNSGGSVIWCGAPPMVARTPFEGLKDLDRTVASRLLGVSFAEANFDPIRASTTSSRMRNMGAPTWWLDNWGADSRSVSEVLAVNQFGQAAAWNKRYGGPIGSGFTRMPCFDGGPGRPNTFTAVQSAAEWRGR